MSKPPGYNPGMNNGLETQNPEVDAGGLDIGTGSNFSIQRPQRSQNISNSTAPMSLTIQFQEIPITRSNFNISQ